jgi:hypothetical protein
MHMLKFCLLLCSFVFNFSFLDKFLFQKNLCSMKYVLLAFFVLSCKSIWWIHGYEFLKGASEEGDKWCWNINVEKEHECWKMECEKLILVRSTKCTIPLTRRLWLMEVILIMWWMKKECCTRGFLVLVIGWMAYECYLE